MLIVGLTGSIGMGKTTTASAFRRLGVFVHNSDLAVHELLGIGGAAVQAVASEFPGVREGNGINRAKLGQIVFSDRSRLHELENILHPLVADHRRRFLMSASRRRERMVVLDVPLLLLGFRAAGRPPPPTWGSTGFASAWPSTAPPSACCRTPS